MRFYDVEGNEIDIQDIKFYVQRLILKDMREEIDEVLDIYDECCQMVKQREVSILHDSYTE